MCACLLPPLSFRVLPDACVLIGPLLNEGSHLSLLLLILGLALTIVLLLYVAGHPAYCSLLYLPGLATSS